MSPKRKKKDSFYRSNCTTGTRKPETGKRREQQQQLQEEEARIYARSH